MRRVPLKGEPNFSNLTDEQVRQYKNMVTDLMGNFSELPDVTSALEIAWKYLSEECVERTCKQPEVEVVSGKSLKLTKKKLVRSPLGRLRK